METTDKIRKTAQDICQKLGFTLYDVSFTNVNNQKTLSIQIDKPKGITLNEVKMFTDLINPELDQMEGLPDSYVLDCSSPGAERFIDKSENLDDYLNQYMEVTAQGNKTLATLIENQTDKIILKGFIKGRPKKYEIDKAKIDKIQLRIKF